MRDMQPTLDALMLALILLLLIALEIIRPIPRQARQALQLPLAERAAQAP